MEEPWRRAKRLSKLAAGPSPGVCTPHSATRTRCKLGPVTIELVGFHGVSRREKSPAQPRAQSDFYLIALHSPAEAFQPCPGKSQPHPYSPGESGPGFPAPGVVLQALAPAGGLTRLRIQSLGSLNEQPAPEGSSISGTLTLPGQGMAQPFPLLCQAISLSFTPLFVTSFAPATFPTTQQQLQRQKD